MKRTSPNGIHFVEQNEGRVLKVYRNKRDPAGTLTVGVGHVVLPVDDLHLGDSITETRCEVFLTYDCAKCEVAINGAVDVDLTQNQFDALVSLCFNIGVYGFLHSTVLRDLNAGNLADEKRAFEMWSKDTVEGRLVVDKDLLARRDRELALFFTPDSAPPAVVAVIVPAPVTVADAPPILPDNGPPTPPSDLPPA
jgi:lysozyme